MCVCVCVCVCTCWVGRDRGWEKVYKVIKFAEQAQCVFCYICDWGFKDYSCGLYRIKVVNLHGSSL